jgi:hypothetical protein
MAATIKVPVSVSAPKMAIANVALDSSYPTGGYTLKPSDFGSSTAIDFVATQSPAGYDFEFDYVAYKLKAYRVNTTGAALGEVPAATNLSAVTVRCIVWGY